jgi:putative toxin-antitoxin system antitoxin component (TIGR02293 family)
MAEGCQMAQGSTKTVVEKTRRQYPGSGKRPGSVSKSKIGARISPYKHVKILGQSVGLTSDKKASIIKALKSGLPISSFKKLQKIMDVPAGELALTVNIALRTLSRRNKQGRLQTDESERLLRIGRLFDMALELFEDKRLARQWFKEPNKALGGSSPLNYSDTEPGAKEVELLIGRLEHGVFS